MVSSVSLHVIDDALPTNILKEIAA